MAVEELLLPENPVYELVLRGVVVYFALMVAFRLIGRHGFSQTSAFDLILLLIISESVSVALNVNDNSLTAGLIVMSTLFVLNYLMSWAQFRSKTLKRLFSGESELLIRDGKPDARLMKKERITQDDIDSSLRAKGIDGMHRVRLGYLEDDGQISALLRHEPTSEQLQAAAVEDEGGKKP